MTIEILKEGISRPLSNFLSVSNQGNSGVSPSTPSNNNISDILLLINQILPQLPPSVTPIFVNHENKYILPPSSSPSPAAADSSSSTDSSHMDFTFDDDPSSIPPPPSPPASSSSEPLTSNSILLFHQHLDLFFDLEFKLYNLIKTGFNRNINSVIRNNCLSIIMKMIYLTPPEYCIKLLKDTETSSFVAELLSSNRLEYIGNGILLSEIMMDKLPDIFVIYFVKEGVLFQINKLSSSSPPPLPSSFSPSSPAAAAALSPSPSLSLDHSKYLLSSFIHSRATQFKLKYFNQEDKENIDTKEVKTIKEIISTLNSKDKEYEEDKEAELVKELGGIFNEKGKLSSYEFERSGIIDGMYNYLTLNQSYLDPSLSAPSNQFPLSKIERRWDLFFNQFIKNNENCNSVKNFIQLLQSSLSLNENYQVSSNNKPNTHPFYHLRFLARPFYFDLSLQENKEEEEATKEYGSIKKEAIQIEPLITVEKLIEFVIRKLESNKGNNGNTKSASPGYSSAYGSAYPTYSSYYAAAASNQPPPSSSNRYAGSMYNSPYTSSMASPFGSLPKTTSLLHKPSNVPSSLNSVPPPPPSQSGPAIKSRKGELNSPTLSRIPPLSMFGAVPKPPGSGKKEEGAEEGEGRDDDMNENELFNDDESESSEITEDTSESSDFAMNDAEEGGRNKGNDSESSNEEVGMEMDAELKYKINQLKEIIQRKREQDKKKKEKRKNKVNIVEMEGNEEKKPINIPQKTESLPEFKKYSNSLPNSHGPDQFLSENKNTNKKLKNAENFEFKLDENKYKNKNKIQLRNGKGEEIKIQLYLNNFKLSKKNTVLSEIQRIYYLTQGLSSEEQARKKSENNSGNKLPADKMWEKKYNLKIKLQKKR